MPHRVQFQKLPREVFVHAPVLGPPEFTVGANRFILGQIDLHRRMPDRRRQQIGITPGDVGADRVIAKGLQIVADVVGLIGDGDPVGPRFTSRSTKPRLATAGRETKLSASPRCISRNCLRASGKADAPSSHGGRRARVWRHGWGAGCCRDRSWQAGLLGQFVGLGLGDQRGAVIEDGRSQASAAGSLAANCARSRSGSSPPGEGVVPAARPVTEADFFNQAGGFHHKGSDRGLAVSCAWAACKSNDIPEINAGVADLHRCQNLNLPLPVWLAGSPSSPRERDCVPPRAALVSAPGFAFPA